jgi:hypothetical protein
MEQDYRVNIGEEHGFFYPIGRLMEGFVAAVRVQENRNFLILR